MRAKYLGQVSFSLALQSQTAGEVLGFEPDKPVVTLGLRGDRGSDVFSPPSFVEILQLDRGGQATLHNPGQLVIFPVLDVRPLGGARRWMEILKSSCLRLGERVGSPLFWDDRCPGLYAGDGSKVISLGVRLHRGVSTHGVAINVRNNLAEFEWIRACGQAGARLAHLQSDLSLSDVFAIWLAEFQGLVCEVDKSAKVAEFMDRSITVGSVGAVGSAFP